MTGDDWEAIYADEVEHARSARFALAHARQPEASGAPGLLSGVSLFAMDQHFLAFAGEKLLLDCIGAGLVFRKWRLPLLIEGGCS